MTNLFHRIEKLLAAGQSVAVASIVRGLGSAPRHLGTRCGVLTDGTLLGTIGGGLAEAQTQQVAGEALAENRARLLELRLDNRDLAAAGMVCGGTMDIAVVPWRPQQRVLAREAAALLEGGGTAALVLRWSQDGAVWTQDLWREEGWLGEGVQDTQLPELLGEVRVSRRPEMHGDRSAGLVVDPLLRQRTPLLVLGGGHVGRALARVAVDAEFSVTVVDDRPEFASVEHIPWADQVLCRPFPGAVDAARPDSGTFVVICTRGHLSDTECTEQALRSLVPYVGVIGSRRKRGMLLKHLRQQGIGEQRLKALRIPVGLPIGAETPEEIAVSVVAEMIQVRRSGILPF